MILDSHKILMERDLWKHLLQLPTHISYKGRPVFSGLYCENKGWMQHTLLITRQPVSADKSFSFYSVWTFLFSFYDHCLSSQHHHIAVNSLAPPITLYHFVGSSFEILSAEQLPFYLATEPKSLWCLIINHHLKNLN